MYNGPSHGAFVFTPEEGEIETAGMEAEEAGGSATPKVAERKREASPGRPRGFEDFVGQKRAVENLLLAAKAAAARGEPLSHVLLSGLLGLGKTTLARLLAAACGSSLQEVVAGNIADPHQLISILARMEKGGFVFIDEIHALRTACAELLYPALEDGVVQVVLRQGGRTRLLRVRLEPFTLVGATTRLGALGAPFRARFPLCEALEPYGEEELAELVSRVAARLGAPVTATAALEVARRSRGTPREAIRLLERARDIAQVSETPELAESAGRSSVSQVTVDSEAILARKCQKSSLSADGVTSQNIKIMLRSENSGETYVNAEAASTVGDAPPCGPGALTPAAPEQASADPGIPEVVAESAQGSPMSQVTVGSEAILAPTCQESSSSTDGATSQNVKIVLIEKNSGETYVNSEAEPRANPPARFPLRQVNVIHGAPVREAAGRAGLDERGLSRDERAVVRLLLERDAPVGLEAIASMLGLGLETLRDVHEPWLERTGLVERTVHGRVATEKARAWYGRSATKAPEGPAAGGKESKCAAQDGGRRTIHVLRLPFRFG